MQDNGELKKRSGFTLAELLVTIAIIGIMCVIALPALTNITGQSKMDGAANAVHSAVKLAQQYASAHNQPTYLAFHTDQTDSNLAYRAYSVFTIDIHTNPVTQAAGKYLTDWEILPDGIVFNNTAAESLNNIFLNNESTWHGGFGANRTLKIGADSYPVVAFGPKGTRSKHDNANDIYLASGFYNRDGQLVLTSQQGECIRVDSRGNSRITPTVYDESAEHIEPGQ
jgi:prepilin-type N-terminal cleavage/methylation domain-containing protein